jgi:hypothetical protein
MTRIVLVVTGALLAACGAVREDAPLAVPVLLHGSAHCTTQDPIVRWIPGEQEWLAAYRSTSSGELVARPPPSVDFATEGVLLIAMGSRPTGGFALSPAGAPTTLLDGVLRVMVEWREPAAGAIVPQVLTSPCLFLKLPAARFERIEVVNGDGHVRLTGRR